MSWAIVISREAEKQFLKSLLCCIMFAGSTAGGAILPVSQDTTWVNSKAVDGTLREAVALGEAKHVDCIGIRRRGGSAGSTATINLVARAGLLNFSFQALPSSTSGTNVLKATLWVMPKMLTSAGNVAVVAVTGKSWTDFGSGTLNSNSFTVATPQEAIFPVSPASVDRWVAVDVTSLVQDWVDGNLPENGVMLVPAVETTGTTSAPITGPATDGTATITGSTSVTGTGGTAVSVEFASKELGYGAPYIDVVLVSDGVSGPQGSSGPQGAAGPQGPMGLTGSTGATGPQGPTGLTGAQGLPGPQGPMGLTGSTGAAGSLAPSIVTGSSLWISGTSSSVNTTGTQAAPIVMGQYAPLKAVPGTVICCVGDSLTYGVNATGSGTNPAVMSSFTSPDIGPHSSGSQCGWPAMLSTMSFCGGTNATVHNFGVIGWTTTAELTNNDYEFYAQPYRPASNGGFPCYCLFWFGANDAYFFQTPATMFISNLETLWAKAHSDGMIVVAFTVTASTRLSAAAESLRQQYNNLIRQDSGYDILIDADQLFQGCVTNPYLFGDQLHLTDAGYLKIAQLVNYQLATFQPGIRNIYTSPQLTGNGSSITGITAAQIGVPTLLTEGQLMTPTLYRQLLASGQVYNACGLSPSASGSGSFSNSASPQSWGLSSGLTPNSSGAVGLIPSVYISGVSVGLWNWGTPHWIDFRNGACQNYSGAGKAVIRVMAGRNELSYGDIDIGGVGVEFRFDQGNVHVVSVRLMTQTVTGDALNTSSRLGTADMWTCHDWLIFDDGAGNASLYEDGALLGSQAGAPTNWRPLGYMEVMVSNGGDSASCEANFRPGIMVWKEQGNTPAPSIP